MFYSCALKARAVVGRPDSSTTAVPSLRMTDVVWLRWEWGTEFFGGVLSLCKVKAGF